jgi:CheY-like chemotaxis protein
MRNRIVLVEDTIGIREGVADFLRLKGYLVDTFDSGFRALEFLETGPRPDLILLDLILKPDMNGWQFAEAVKTNRKLTEIPIVALSGAVLSREQLRQIRAEAFLAKPFELEQLLDVVQRYSGHSEPVN